MTTPAKNMMQTVFEADNPKATKYNEMVDAILTRNSNLEGLIDTENSQVLAAVYTQFCAYITDIEGVCRTNLKLSCKSLADFHEKEHRLLTKLERMKECLKILLSNRHYDKQTHDMLVAAMIEDIQTSRRPIE